MNPAWSPDFFRSILNAYRNNENITQLVLSMGYSIDANMVSLIYELQSGSYSEWFKNNLEFMHSYSQEIIQCVENFIPVGLSWLDCGIGEGTGVLLLLEKLKPSSLLGVDGSISRLTYAADNLSDTLLPISLAVANMDLLPLEDNSVDVVLTMHSLEPNGGNEIKLLSELSRVARRYLVLVEPDYEIAGEEQKHRMDTLNYVRGLENSAEILGLRRVAKSAMVNNSNKLNAASIWIFEKNVENSEGLSNPNWVDPIFHLPLEKFECGLRNELGLWFPSIRDIPLLRAGDEKFLLNPRLIF